MDIKISAGGITFDFKSVEIVDELMFQKHIHPYSEILYVTGGIGEYLIEDKIYTLEKGDLMFIAPGKYHCPKIETLRGYCRVVINFDGSAVPRDLVRYATDDREFFRLPEGSAAERLVTQFPAFAGAIDEKYRETACRNLLETLLLSLRTDASERSEAQARRVSRACSEILRYINDNFTTLNSLNDIAGHFYLSKPYLNHIFKSSMHIGIMQYIRQKKIVYAQKLIENGEKPTQIYEKCGFANYTTFYRAYKNFLNASPFEAKKSK